MNPDDVTLEQHITTELAKLGEKDPNLAERIRDLFPSGATGTGNGCIAEAMVRFLDALRAGELDQEQVLRIAGPYFNGSSPPDDTAVFTRLALFGRIVHLCPNPAPREYACQLWAEHLKQWYRTFMPSPRRVVDAAVLGHAAGNAKPGPRWYADSELSELPPTADLIAGHIPQSGLVLVYGPSGHGKTFIELDVAQSVGTGLAWHGHAVKQGPVAYISAEGIGGLAARVDAWKRFHKWSGSTNVRFLPQPVHLLEPAELATLTATLRGWDPPPILVVVETVAWCLPPGDENSTRDMSAFVAAAGTLRATLHATVLLSHHTGHDKSRERGNTALAAACDTVVRVKREDDRVVLTCAKQREDAPFAPLRFRLAKSAGSLVPQLAIDAGDGGRVLTPKQREALQVLNDITGPGESTDTATWYESTGFAKNTFYSGRRALIARGLVRAEKRRNFPTLLDDSDDAVPSTDEVPF